MMLSVAGLCLRPEYQSTMENNTVLLTEQYSNKIVDSLLKKNPALDLIRSNEAAEFKNSKVLVSYQQLSDPTVKIKAVVGNGIPEYAMASVGAKFEYYPPKPSSGVTNLYLPKDVQRNNEYHIQGNFFNTKDSVKLFLENAGNKTDSIQLGRGLHRFDLRFTPRANGNLIYHLRSSDDHIVRPIPLHVNPERPLNILVLQGYPTFEIQYLKTFLADKHHQLALRYQLSKAVFRFEYANRKSLAVHRINQSSLTEFDLLISDTETLSKLSAPERAAITDAIKHGLGFLATFPATPKSIQLEFLPINFKKTLHDTTTLKIGSSTYSLPAIPLRPNISETISSVTTNRTGALSGYTYMDKGRIGFQLLQETYRLVLSGDTVNYGRLWSSLIDGISRTNEKNSEILLDQNVPIYTDEPFNAKMISSESKPSLFADGISVPLIEDEAIDDIWHLKLWAGRPGWHQLSLDRDAAQYFVFNDGDWRDLRAASTIESNHVASAQLTASKASTTNMPYPPIYFYMMFVIAAGCLWLAPKL
ncbi:MAG: hypothetical protein ABI477_00565 [Chryseolinea sp.]